MSLNTFPCNPYPISTEELNKGNNDVLNTRVSALETAVEEIDNDKTDLGVIAAEFDSEAGTYEIGDLVTNEGKLYEFTSDHSAPGAWDPTEVTEKTVADEVNFVKSGLTNYERDNNWRIEAPERKNHYDYNSPRLMRDANRAWWLSSETNQIALGGSTNYTWAVKCNPNTTYTISLTHTSTTFRVAYGEMADLAWVTTDDTSRNIYGLQSISETGDVSITITTGSDATYLFIQLGASDVDTAILTLQVEIGDIATAYTPYIPSVESRLAALEAAIAQIGS